jgi:Patched family
MFSSCDSPSSIRIEEQLGGYPVILEEEEEEDTGPDSKTFSQYMTKLVNSLRRPISNCVLAITHNAATHPYLYIMGTIHLSLLLIAFGLFTNFRMEVDSESLYGVIGSEIAEHRHWINEESGFGQYNARLLTIMVHADGNNVIGDSGIRRCFVALKVVTATGGFDEVCSKTQYVDWKGDRTCDVRGVTKFWNGDFFQYRKQVDSDNAVQITLSKSSYPDGAAVDLSEIMGNYSFDNGTLTYAESFLITLPLPTISDAVSFEGKALDGLLQLQEEWDNEEGNMFRLAVQAERSLDDESTRSILEDMPLIPLVFVVMSVFTCFVFWQNHKVKSQSLLGFGAVISVLLAVASGYGLLFTVGEYL